jgi:hypothetical protein
MQLVHLDFYVERSISSCVISMTLWDVSTCSLVDIYLEFQKLTAQILRI